MTQGGKSPENQGTATYKVVHFRPRARLPATDEPALFETVRVLDLQRLRRRLSRASKNRSAEWLEAASDCLGTAKRLSGDSRLQAPEIVVIRRPDGPLIKPDYAIVGKIVFLGEHLSASWVDGEESVAALRALQRALDEYVRISVPAYRPPQ